MLSLSCKPKWKTVCVFVFVIKVVTQLQCGKTPHMMENNKLNLMDGVKMYT